MVHPRLAHSRDSRPPLGVRIPNLGCQNCLAFIVAPDGAAHNYDRAVGQNCQVVAAAGKSHGVNITPGW